MLPTGKPAPARNRIADAICEERNKALMPLAALIPPVVIPDPISLSLSLALSRRFPLPHSTTPSPSPSPSPVLSPSLTHSLAAAPPPGLSSPPLAPTLSTRFSLGGAHSRCTHQGYRIQPWPRWPQYVLHKLFGLCRQLDFREPGQKLLLGL